MVIVDVSICHDRDFIYEIPKLILEIEYWPSKNIEKTKQKKRQSFSRIFFLMKFRGSNIIVILLAS